jgi:hypothetical protein
MNNDQFEALLNRTLKRRAEASPADKEAADRVFARLSATLPRQKKPFWRLPEILLDWEFAPAWPRMAALASFAALGFVIGMVGLDRRVDTADAASYVTSGRADLGSIVFEGEPLTGAHP